jgi:hypothetical protein
MQCLHFTGLNDPRSFSEVYYSALSIGLPLGYLADLTRPIEQFSKPKHATATLPAHAR